MSRDSTLGVGIVGLGFMGRTHLRAFAKAAAEGFPNRLVAVADADPRRRRGEAGDALGNLEGANDGPLFDPSEVRGYERAEDLIACPEVDLVSICTPTATHVPLALACVEAGKHVLVEKPVALSAGEVERLDAAARAAGVRVMPAMCVRFWPAWRWLRDRIEDGSLGGVRSAVFRRLGTRPEWGAFYRDPEQTGGALFDLHIHDADFVRFCFGPPDRVDAVGDLDHLTATYRYASGPPHVVAEGGWDHSPGFPFRMLFTVVFERATADFELGRDPELLLARDGRIDPVEMPPLSGYDLEVRHLLGAIGNPDLPLDATVAEALELTRMLEEERAALEG